MFSQEQHDSVNYDWMHLTIKEIYEKVSQYDEEAASRLLETGISDGLWTGDISIGTYCRHLEYLLQNSEDDDSETIIYGHDEDDNTVSSDQSTEVYGYNSDTDETDERIAMRIGSLGNVELSHQDMTLPPDPIGEHRVFKSMEDQQNEWNRGRLNRNMTNQEETIEFTPELKDKVLEDTEIEYGHNPMIDEEAIKWINDFMYEPGRLAELQKEEMEWVKQDPDRMQELQEDLEALRMEQEEYGPQWELKPKEFPDELWRYVRPQQKEICISRFDLFADKTVLQALIEDINNKLNINKQNEEVEKFLKAQAIANLDCYGYPDPDKPPTIPGYSMPLKLKDNVPVYTGPQRYAIIESAFLKARVHEFTTSGKIEEAEESMYNSPVKLVPYPDRIKAFMQKHGEKAMDEMFKPENYKVVGTFYRFTTNLRKVNQKTEPFHFPVPDATDVYHYTRGSRYYSSVDFRDAFFTVALAEEDRDKTAFTTPYGRFQWCVLPQGALNSSKLYSKVTLDTLHHIPKTELINYIDDSLVHSRRFLKHMEILQKMYDAMRIKTMVCKIDKSHLGHHQMKALGHIISDTGRSPDPKLVNKILNMAEPKDLAGVRSFLGILNFNREYIPNLSSIIAPLQDLTCKNERSVAERWNEEHTKAFNAAKHSLTSAPCLLTIDPTKPFVIHTDACKVGRRLETGSILLI